MKLIWHIIRKDILRDRWALALWALLFVGQVVIGVVARNPDDMGQDYFRKLQSASIALVALQMVMGYVLVARFVQADVLIGTTAFWTTRPISAARLFFAKSLGAILIFGMLPVLLLLPWWLYCGFGVHDVFWSAIDTLGWQLLMIALAFLVASLTDDLGRVLLWTLLCVIGILSWLALLQSSFGSAIGQGAAGIKPGVMFTKLWLSAVVLVIGSGTVAAHHYLTRRFVGSVLLVVAGLGLVAATGQWCARDLSGAIASWGEPAIVSAPGLAEQVSLRVERARGGRTLSSSRGRVPTENAYIEVLLRATGLPDGLSLGVRSSEQIWTWSDGIKLGRNGWFAEVQSARHDFVRRHYALPQPEADPETKQWEQDERRKIAERQRARGFISVQQPDLPANRLGLLIHRNNIPNSFLAKMQSEPPAYRADLQCVAFRPEMLAEVSLKSGTLVHGGGETFGFRELGSGEDALISTQPTMALWGLWFSAGISDRFRGLRPRRSMLTVNRATGDIVEEWGLQSRGSIQMMFAGVVVSWSKYGLQAPLVIRAGKQVVKDPQWREHTFLAVVVDREVSRFARTATTDRFEVLNQENRP